MPIRRHGERVRRNRLQVICFLRVYHMFRLANLVLTARLRGDRKKNVHSNSPLTAFVRTGTLCALLNIALPNPPYCPLPQDKISTFLIDVPSIRSTVKNAKSPPAFKSMHRVRVLLGVPLHSTTSVGTVIVSSDTFPPRPICLYRQR